jgi:hypothetical protein
MVLCSAAYFNSSSPQDKRPGCRKRSKATWHQGTISLCFNREEANVFVICFFVFCLFFNQRCLIHIYVCNGVTPRVKSSIEEETKTKNRMEKKNIQIFSLEKLKKMKITNKNANFNNINSFIRCFTNFTYV